MTEFKLEPNEKHPVWQSLVNVAYERWQPGNDLAGKSYEDFVGELPDIQARAVAFKNLNYQVHNGGFSQWHGNGYSSDSDIILESLENFLDTDAGEELLDLMRIAYEDTISFFEGVKDEYVEAARHIGASRLHDFQNQFMEMVEEKMYDELSDLDKRYYANSDQLMDDIEAWLASTQEGQEALLLMQGAA